MTKEEKAEEYGQMVAEGTGIIDFKHVSTNAYMDGYNEAMRWRDPKEELPDEVGLYLCKCKSNRLGFYFEIVFFNKVWRSDNIIGWRPIE